MKGELKGGNIIVLKTKGSEKRRREVESYSPGGSKRKDKVFIVIKYHSEKRLQVE